MSKINQENICLLCNGSNSFSSTTTDLSCEIRKFIKLLRRFIEDDSNENKILVESLLESEYSNLLNWCEKCFSAVDQFSKLFHELKCLEMQLEWRLGELIKRIELGSKLPPRTFNFGKLLNETFKNNTKKSVTGVLYKKR